MIHHVYAHRLNIGDWLSALGIQRLLRTEPWVEHFCNDPFVDATLERLSSLNERDAIVIGGGGLFMDYFARFWEGLLEVAPRVPTFIWGVGYCDLKTTPSRPPIALLREVARVVKLCVVRDDLTREALGRGLVGPSVPCPSIAAVGEEPPGFGLLHMNNYSTVGAPAYEAMCEAGYRFASRTERRYLESNNQIAAGRKDRLEGVISLYRRADLVLSSGLHGCIIGLTMGRKVLAVSGDWKIESFMVAAGLEDWVIDYREVGRVPEMLERLREQPDRTEFIQRARLQNSEIASKIRRLAGWPREVSAASGGNTR